MRDDARPLSASLGLVAHEVSDLVRLAERLQTVIAHLAAGGPAPDLNILIDAQAADLLTQRLAGLAVFVQALSQAAPVEVSADVEAAVRALTLSEQARRLSGIISAVQPEGAGDTLTFWD